MLPQRQEIASVVVCEDDDVTLDLLCDHLAADRFGVLPAPSASDALRLCRYNQPDLLLLDLSLPDASGLDVLREIREADGVESRFDPRLPVIVLTGRGADTDRVRGLDSGADDYVTKPFAYRRAARPDRRRPAPPRGPPRRPQPDRRPHHRPDPPQGHRSASARWRWRRRSSPCCASSPATRPGSSPRRSCCSDVWGFRSPGRTRTLDSHASRLRRKLDPEHSRYVVNCWGIGYRLVDG